MHPHFQISMFHAKSSRLGGETDFQILSPYATSTSRDVVMELGNCTLTAPTRGSPGATQHHRLPRDYSDAAYLPVPHAHAPRLEWISGSTHPAAGIHPCEQRPSTLDRQIRLTTWPAPHCALTRKRRSQALVRACSPPI